MGRQRAREPESLLHHLPQRARAEVSRVAARQGQPDRALRHLPSPAGSQDRAGGGAHAGPRRQDVVRVVPQPARVDQQRQGFARRQLDRGELYQLSHGDARAGVVGACAGSGELRDLPRPARIVQRPDAERANADALSAVPHRDAASRVDLRPRRDHHQQEQPDVRTVVRELSLQRSRLQPSVRAVLHALVEARMRSFARIPLVWSVALGLVAWASPLRAQEPAQVPAQAPAQAPPAAAAEPQASPLEGARSLFDPTWRQVTFGGAFSSIDGDPTRFQRYQDMRDGVLVTDARYAFENPEGNWLFQAGADRVGRRDQRYFASYERIGRFSVTGLWDEIPQFYSVDTATAF